MQEATTHKAIHEALRTIYGEEIARKVMGQVIGKYGWSFIPGGGVLEKMAEAIKLEMSPSANDRQSGSLPDSPGLTPGGDTNSKGGISG